METIKYYRDNHLDINYVAVSGAFWAQFKKIFEQGAKIGVEWVEENDGVVVVEVPEELPLTA